MPEVKSAYLVCATPRSGSTLLCEMLGATERAGNPQEHFEVLRHSSLPRQPREYFSDLRDPRLERLLAPVEPGTPDPEPPEQWWQRILRQGTSANGVWGGKLMWGHVGDLLSRARELPGYAGVQLEQALRGLLPAPRIVLVSRADKVGQAISLWRAVQTQSWRSGAGDATREPVYSFTAIDHLRRQLAEQEEAWQEWVQQVTLPVLQVGYRELDASPRQTVEQVLAWLGLVDDAVPEPPLSRQRDELSLLWAERYQHDSEQAA